MRTLGKMTALSTVLGLCLPSYGEVLVYKASQTTTVHDQGGQGQWEMTKLSERMYIVLDFNYQTGATMNSAEVRYGRDANGKWFKVTNPANWQLVRADDGARVRWILIQTQQAQNLLNWVIAQVGVASNKNIGTAQKQEVASKLSGVGSWIDGRTGLWQIGLAAPSTTLYPAWTHWANGTGPGQGNRNFMATLQMIANNLTGKGYTQM